MNSFETKRPNLSYPKKTIQTIEELNILLNDGYEVIDRYYNLEFHKNQNDEFVNSIISGLVLKKGRKTTHVITDSLGLYPMQFEKLYDFEKKRPIFIHLPDHEVHVELEAVIVDMIAPRFKKSIETTDLVFNNSKKVYQILQEFVKSEKNLVYVGFPKLHLSDIFSQVLIIEEIEDDISFNIVSKEKITLKEIQQIQGNSKSKQNSIALSFFYLTKKISQNKNFNDVVVGLILYDIKNEKTLCFRTVSSSYFYQHKTKNNKLGKYDVVLDIFNECIKPNMKCNWYLPSALDHPWYTPMPWIHYIVLLPMKNDENESDIIAEERKISLSEYFVFGIPKWPANHDNFVFENFASFKEGRATILFDFNDEKRITYPLRFDQSKGEPLVHLDFTFYDGEQQKLIAHRPLDLETVSSFNLSLYGSILAAGFFDGYFSTIIQKGLKGIEELTQKNPAYLYPLKLMWQVETAIIWLNENGGYDLLDSIQKPRLLESRELSLAKKMQEEHLTILAKGKNDELWGLTPIGHVVLYRHLTGQTNLSLNSEE